MTKEEIPSDTDKMVTRDEITTKGLYGLSICHDDDDAVAESVYFLICENEGRVEDVIQNMRILT